MICYFLLSMKVYYWVIRFYLKITNSYILSYFHAQMQVYAYIICLLAQIFVSWTILRGSRSLLRHVYFCENFFFNLLRTLCPHLGSFCVVFFFHYVSTKFHLWPSSGDLPRPRIRMMSLVTVSLSIFVVYRTTFFDQVNLWSAWVGFETTIFWQCSPGTVETQRQYPLRHGPRMAIKDGFLGL